MNVMSDRIHSVGMAIEAFARGEIVVVTDDYDRENEGDLFVAASLCTPEKMAFIVRHTSGIVCAPLPAEEARRLHLDPMVAKNEAPLGTAFTVSVDVRHGLTTGISAEERCNTVRALANDNSGAADFVRPGHVFPLVARQGGVLMRSGHTEACVDLCRLASLPPVALSRKGSLRLIRPLLYVTEDLSTEYARVQGFLPIACVCGEKESVRREIREFLDSMKLRHPGIAESIMAALGNVNLFTLALEPAEAGASVSHGIDDEIDS